MPASDACRLFLRCVHRGASLDWQKFLRRYGAQVRSAIYRACSLHSIYLQDGEIEDLSQELLYRLISGRGHCHFRGQTNVHLWHYLRQVARNLAIDRRRSTHALKRRAESYPCHGLLRDIEEHTASTDASPEAAVLEKERWRIFFGHCRTVIGEQRGQELRILDMALREGRTSREIAARLGGRVNPDKIDHLVCRVRRRVAAQGLPVPSRNGRWSTRPKRASCGPTRTEGVRSG